MASHQDNSSENNENESNPFGIDPEAISGMINEMMSKRGMGNPTGVGAMNNPMGEGPMGIASRVAAEIASKEIDDTLGIEDTEDVEANTSQDPMVEIMGIISMLSSPSQNTKALPVDKAFEDRCVQIYPAAQNYVAREAKAETVNLIHLVVTDRVTWTKDYISSMQGPLEVTSKYLNPSFSEKNDE